MSRAAVLFGNGGLFQELVELFADALVLVLKHRAVTRKLSLDHTFAVDENELRNITRLRGQPLQIVEHGVTRRIAHGEGRAKLLDERTDQTDSALIKCNTQDLNTARPVFVLNSTQNLSSVLAMRSSGVEEFEEHNFTCILAEKKLAAVRHGDSKFR